MECRLFRHVLAAAQQLLGARPPDFHAAEQIRFRARHFEYALGLEVWFGPENLRIGTETHLGTAPVRRLAALERHAVKPLAARNLDFHTFRERVRYRHADAV